MGRGGVCFHVEKTALQNSILDFKIPKTELFYISHYGPWYTGTSSCYQLSKSADIWILRYYTETKFLYGG